MSKKYTVMSTRREVTSYACIHVCSACLSKVASVCNTETFYYGLKNVTIVQQFLLPAEEHGYCKYCGQHLILSK